MLVLVGKCKIRVRFIFSGGSESIFEFPCEMECLVNWKNCLRNECEKFPAKK